jgi:hypothetical protein
MIIKFLQSRDTDQEQDRSRSLAGSAVRNISCDAELTKAGSKGDVSEIVAAHLNERDYRLAKIAIPALRAFQDYEDWLDFRDGSLWGLIMAGIDVAIIPVDLVAFVLWCRATSTRPSLSALDGFASVHRTRNLAGDTKRIIF